MSQKTKYTLKGIAGEGITNAGSEVKKLDTKKYAAFHPRGEDRSNGTVEYL